VQFEQRFIDTAQLFGAQVLVIHPPPGVLLLGEGQRAHGVEQRLVIHLGIFQIGQGRVREQETAQHRQANILAAWQIACQQVGKQLHALP